jgi:hypothetical protein
MITPATHDKVGMPGQLPEKIIVVRTDGVRALPKIRRIGRAKREKIDHAH